MPIQPYTHIRCHWPRGVVIDFEVRVDVDALGVVQAIIIRNHGLEEISLAAGDGVRAFTVNAASGAEGTIRPPLPIGRVLQVTTPSGDGVAVKIVPARIGLA